MWEIYDALINGIPDELKTDEIICGYPHTYVRSGEGSGIAGIRLVETRMPMFTKDLLGLPLREVATCIKSWNFIEASVGLAAINAYYNNPQVARKNGVEFSEAKRVEDRMNDPFIMSQNEVRGKKVAVIGHFPYLNRLMEPICDLAIIEADPGEGDYPMSASEYILPECDYVYITSSCLVDKTLPRLLELSGNAKRVTLVSPGTPLAPQLFDFGLGALSGFIIKDNLRAFRIVAGAERVKIYSAGQKVTLKSNRH
ncbi:Rossmann-like domain-containing protein [Desulfitobacterium sp. AusDCA]|uniref:Rossmann-like domain-containing protein n=1 Tax=Desulfitobacterium sp. AusDCA TaxID=3240383 RepID=UPI003DA77EC0